jgi:predicted nucleic acid-binding protein
MSEGGEIIIISDTSCLIGLSYKKARKYAQSKGFNITGTQGVLLLAEERGIIANAHNYITRLRNIGFRV